MHRFSWERPAAVDSERTARLARALDIPPAAARFLLSRSFDEVSAREYLDPAARQVRDPLLFNNMEQAVDCVRRAVQEKKRILIHGDYDVDGICGTALLYRYLHGRVPHVFRFLPDRRKDGYGIAERAVEWATENHVGLFVTVDCGTSDGELVARLEDEGIDVVVCDHHEYPAEGDVRGIVLNPMGETERYPFSGLCGTGVAFKLACALEVGGVAGAVTTDALLDLFAVATVGDLSPLIDENRYLVREGLKRLNDRGRLGFGALKTGAGLDRPEINSYHIGFILAPRLNAPGRIGNPKPALEILCTKDEREAAELARTLEMSNNERKLLTEAVYEEVLKMIEEIPDRDRRGGFVLAGEGWNEGVLGIAAARIVDEFGKPAILIAVDGTVGKGSGRSVPGVHLKDQLDQCGDYLERYGGHAQAVGLTIDASKIDAFAEALSSRLDKAASGVARRARLTIDTSLDLEECSMELVDFLNLCEPFGNGNTRPVWMISEVTVTPDTRFVGKGHLKLFFQGKNGWAGEGICFNWNQRGIAIESLHGLIVDLAVSIKKGYYLERHYPEIQVLDIREHGE